MMETKSKTSRTNSSATNDAKSKRPYVLPYMQNRELSWLEFNKRVLDQGEEAGIVGRIIPGNGEVTYVNKDQLFAHVGEDEAE